MRESRFQRFARLADMIPYLASHPGCSVTDLAQRFGVTPKHIVKDLETMAVAGDFLLGSADLRVESHEGEVYLHLSEPLERAVRLGAQQTLRLLLATRLLAQLLPERDEELSALILKVASTLPATSVGPESVSVRLEAQVSHVVNQLEAAARSTRRVRVGYRSRGEAEAREREVEPIALFVADDAWYMTAYSPEHEESRSYRVEAVTSVVDVGPATYAHRHASDAGRFSQTPESTVVWAAHEVGPWRLRRLGGQAVGEAELPGGVEGTLWSVPVRSWDSLCRIVCHEGGHLALWERPRQVLDWLRVEGEEPPRGTNSGPAAE